MTTQTPSLFDALEPRKEPPHRAALIAEAVTRYGAEALSDAQIIETMLNRSPRGRAEEILSQAGSFSRLVTMGPAELKIVGLTKSEVARFAVLQEMNRRSSRAAVVPRINAPRAAGMYLLPKAQGWTEERFGMLALNAKGDLLADRILAQGVATACLISPREFFREALRYGAVSAIAWHNHPSGDPTPSREDLALTKRLRASGESLGVPLADHIVVGSDSFHSFRAAEGWDRE
jgi:DNA repair protein RadC